MSRTRNVIALAAVAGVAWAIGRGGLILNSETHAAPAPQDKQAQGDMAAAMAAWEKIGTPSEHHQHLNGMVGTWEAEFKIWMDSNSPPMTSTGTVTRDWVLGKRFVRERVEATSAMGSFNGLGYIGYDNVDGVYQVSWMDDMSTTMMFENGTYDPDTNVLTTHGQHRDPMSGKVLVSRGEVDLSNPNRHVFTSWMTGTDGKEFKHMVGVTERK
jgi:hypothetical protein